MLGYDLVKPKERGKAIQHARRRCKIDMLKQNCVLIGETGQEKLCGEVVAGVLAPCTCVIAGETGPGRLYGVVHRHRNIPFGEVTTNP